MGAGVEGEHVRVEPEGGGGAVGGEGLNEVVGDGKEEGDVGVREGADSGWGGVYESDGGNAAGLEGGHHVLRWRKVGIGGVVGDTEGGGRGGGDGGGEEDEGGGAEKERRHFCLKKHVCKMGSFVLQEKGFVAGFSV